MSFMLTFSQTGSGISEEFSRKERMDLMVEITKSEKEAISEHLPNVHIVRTMKNKSKRHHYYCEETKQVKQLLSQLRKGA